MPKTPEIYPEGLTTGYFGILTQSAIQRFQCEHNIICEGSPQTTGYGLVGPKTRQKLNEIFGSQSTKPKLQITNNEERIKQLKSQIKQLRIQMIKLLNQFIELIQVRLGEVRR